MADSQIPIMIFSFIPLNCRWCFFNPAENCSEFHNQSAAKKKQEKSSILVPSDTSFRFWRSFVTTCSLDFFSKSRIPSAASPHGETDRHWGESDRASDRQTGSQWAWRRECEANIEISSAGSCSPWIPGSPLHTHTHTHARWCFLFCNSPFNKR